MKPSVKNPETNLNAATVARLEELLPDILAFRRDLHRHPELSNEEFRTTQKVADALTQIGLSPEPVGPTGLICDIGPEPENGRLGIRADLDALPITDETDTDYASVNQGISHACGHDVHTSIVLGVGMLLAELESAGELRTGVRLVFQPAEESKIGGARDYVEAGVINNVSRIVALHCDPTLDVGRIGMRVGPITSASDMVFVHLTGAGGHTSRPYLTADVVYALSHLAVHLPAVLTRRVDPRGGASMVWGQIQAGSAPNAIPASGTLSGTLRCLEPTAWEQCAVLLPILIEDLVAPFGVEVDLEHHRGIPPVVNDEDTVNLMIKAGRYEFGNSAVVPTEQSLGGEDFSWYLQECPGALARLGTRTPGGLTYDLHRGDFCVDEAALPIGIRLLTNLALHHGDLGNQPMPVAALPEQTQCP